MPYRTTVEYVDPEVAVYHDGVAIYHAYKNDDYDYPYTFWFVTHPEALEEDSFDVRELASYDPELTVEDNLREAIESEAFVYERRRLVPR